MALLSRRVKSCLPLILVTSILSLVLLYMSSSQEQVDPKLSGNRRVGKRVMLNQHINMIAYQEVDGKDDLKMEEEESGKKSNFYDALVDMKLNEKEHGKLGKVDVELEKKSNEFTNNLDHEKIRNNNNVGPKCDDECERFRQLLSKWPENKPPAALYYLTQTSRMDFFLESIASVDEYFNNQFGYPIIVFHEEEFSPKIPAIRKVTKSNMFFQKIKFEIPEFLEDPVLELIPCTSRISYRHMCRFHAKGIYEEPIMQELKYYWRLDDDSLLLSKVTYDVFKYMENNAFQYGYLWRHLDAMSCTEGLWEATNSHIEANNISTQFFNSWKRPYLFYNNFEISDMAMWISQEYKQYIEYIDKLGGMYYHRWGDAPIKGIAVAMFIPKKDLHLFSDIGYQHRSYVHNGTLT